MNRNFSYKLKQFKYHLETIMNIKSVCRLTTIGAGDNGTIQNYSTLTYDKLHTTMKYYLDVALIINSKLSELFSNFEY